jgi:hypothetical protein
MPCDHGLRFHDAEGRSPFRPNTGEPNPKKTIGQRQPQPLLLLPALEDEELMAQGKDFCLECNSGAERITQDREKGKQERDHRQEAY